MRPVPLKKLLTKNSITLTTINVFHKTQSVRYKNQEILVNFSF